MDASSQALLAEHTALAGRLRSLGGGARAEAIARLIELEDALWRCGARHTSFQHRALFDGTLARLCGLLSEEDYAEASRLTAQVVKGPRLQWALQFTGRRQAEALIKAMLRGFRDDDQHRERSYAAAFRTLRALVGDLHGFMHFEIAAFECEHGDVEKGLQHLARATSAELRGIHGHRAFARVRDHALFLQILETRGVLPRAARRTRGAQEAEQAPAPPGAITAREVAAALPEGNSGLTALYWPSGHLRSAITGAGALQLTETPGSGSVSLVSAGAALSESYREGKARWSIGTPWNDGDDVGEEPLPFPAWVTRWLRQLAGVAGPAAGKGKRGGAWQGVELRLGRRK